MAFQFVFQDGWQFLIVNLSLPRSLQEARNSGCENSGGLYFQKGFWSEKNFEPRNQMTSLEVSLRIIVNLSPKKLDNTINTMIVLNFDFSSQNFGRKKRWLCLLIEIEQKKFKFNLRTNMFPLRDTASYELIRTTMVIRSLKLLPGRM